MILELQNSNIDALCTIMDKLGDVPHAEHAFIVARNLMILKPIREAIQKAQAPTMGFQEYQKQKKVLLDNHATKDASGQPKYKIVDTPQGQVMEYDLADRPGFEAEHVTLLEAHRDALQREAERQQSLPAFLEQTVQLALFEIDSEWCSGILTGKEIAVLLESGVIPWTEPETA